MVITAVDRLQGPLPQPSCTTTSRKQQRGQLLLRQQQQQRLLPYGIQPSATLTTSGTKSTALVAVAAEAATLLEMSLRTLLDREMDTGMRLSKLRDHVDWCTK